MAGPISIYCDWAMHDELGDDVRLSAELTMRALDALKHWRDAHGLTFDYYLLDCFWFDQPGDYTRFDRKMWPDGFEPARRRMEELGMKPGLWLDTTGAAVAGWRPWQEGPAEHGWEPWSGSLDRNGEWSYCLFDGPYAEGLLDAMVHAVEEWGVGLFKFDFANFRAVTERCGHLDEGEVYARNVAAFKDVLRRVRERAPGVVFLAYNGFAYAGDYLGRTTDPVVPGVEPHWLKVIDYLYSGDPRPADAPCTSLRRAVDVYQDHMVRKFHRSGIPLSRIDDHGCMVGDTNTIYYLGKRGWRRTWVQSLARGSRKAHLYGDVTLLDDQDVRFLKSARDLFFGLFREGAATRSVGGVPAQSPWHGFLTGDAEDGLLCVVNSGAGERRATLELSGLGSARVLFHDEGRVPTCDTAGDTLSVTLAPEQMALVGLGRCAEERFELGTNVGGDPVPGRAERLELDFAAEGNGLVCGVPAAEVMTQAEAGGFDELRLSVRLRQEGRAYRRACPRNEVPSDVLGIRIEADGREVPPRRRVPQVKVWSGCSWVTCVYGLEDLREADELRITFRCPDPEPEAFAEAWLQSVRP